MLSYVIYRKIFLTFWLRFRLRKKCYVLQTIHSLDLSYILTFFLCLNHLCSRHNTPSLVFFPVTITYTNTPLNQGHFERLVWSVALDILSFLVRLIVEVDVFVACGFWYKVLFIQCYIHSPVPQITILNNCNNFSWSCPPSMQLRITNIFQIKEQSLRIWLNLLLEWYLLHNHKNSIFKNENKF